MKNSAESPRREMLNNAADLVDGARNAQYGDPKQDFKRTAAYWNIHINALLQRRYAAQGENFTTEGLISPHDVAIMMDLLKTSRLGWDPHNEDTWIDKAGYSSCGWDCALEDTKIHD